MSLKLENDHLTLNISQKGGAIISGHLRDGRAFLRPSPAAVNVKITDQACFPMVPLCNRLGGNQFNFEGRTYDAQANSDVGPLYIHGDGWLADWVVIAQSANSLTLGYEHSANKDAPFSYAAKQIFLLDGETLRIMLEVTNTGEVALPFGFGLHPFFPRSDEVTIAFTSSGHWENDIDVLPETWTPSEGVMDFNRPRRLPKRLIDNCFMDWDGKAEIVWPNKNMGLVIKADDIFKYCQIYAPQREPFFCFEPMSHMADGLRREGYPGFHILQPEQKLSGSVGFSVRDRL